MSPFCQRCFSSKAGSYGVMRWLPAIEPCPSFGPGLQNQASGRREGEGTYFFCPWKRWQAALSSPCLQVLPQLKRSLFPRYPVFSDWATWAYEGPAPSTLKGPPNSELPLEQAQRCGSPLSAQACAFSGCRWCSQTHSLSNTLLSQLYFGKNDFLVAFTDFYVILEEKGHFRVA